MINKHKVDIVKIELNRFTKAINNLENRLLKEEYYKKDYESNYSGLAIKESASLKRASMDLSNKLVELRK